MVSKYRVPLVSNGPAGIKEVENFSGSVFILILVLLIFVLAINTILVLFITLPCYVSSVCACFLSFIKGCTAFLPWLSIHLNDSTVLFSRIRLVQICFPVEKYAVTFLHNVVKVFLTEFILEVVVKHRNIM
ncbi:hypothetical protein L6164_023094 [Bauhinia variegata]|uniref:Uncharacterized protein n=1 Tax=Bauhinia variegata TaxID=167791 RepID=A0ACB9MHM9_BAUVA|nr:hypothetical protein L6164_023094 [Bauhinia variegata]